MKLFALFCLLLPLTATANIHTETDGKDMYISYRGTREEIVRLEFYRPEEPGMQLWTNKGHYLRFKFGNDVAGYRNALQALDIINGGRTLIVPDDLERSGDTIVLNGAAVCRVNVYYHYHKVTLSICQP